MADTKINLDSIKALADLAIKKDLTEIEYESAKLRLRIARHGSTLVTTAAPAPPPASAVTSAPLEADPPEVDDSAAYVDSPMVGTFYVSPAPGAPAFIEPGDRVKKGQVVCIVEAMKLMNEIEAEVDGILAERLVENGEGVEFGQQLFKIMPSE